MSRDKPKDFIVDGSGMRIGIVAARYNQKLVDAMLANVLTTLDEAGVNLDDIETVRVPGSNEVPFACSMLALGEQFDALIGLGLVLAGETNHHDVIAHSTADAMHRIAEQNDIPVINGIVVVNNEEQARSRCEGELNRGNEFAKAALEMAELNHRLKARVIETNEQMRQLYEEMDSFIDDLVDEEEDDGEDWKR